MIDQRERGDKTRGERKQDATVETTTTPRTEYARVCKRTRVRVKERERQRTREKAREDERERITGGFTHRECLVFCT